MNDSLVAIIVAIISSNALTAFVSAVVANRRGISAGVRMLLYDRIKHLGKGYISRGYITSEELEDIVSLHEVYHTDLKGNGFLNSVMDNVKALPIKNGGKTE